MTYAAQTSRYLENEIMSRRPEWLVPLLYEHLLISLERSIVQITALDYDGKSKSLGKAASIVAELHASLDQEKGGEIATQLSGLYAYFTVEILNAGRTLDVALLRRLAAMVAELHDAWKQAAEQIAPRASATTASASLLQLA